MNTFLHLVDGFLNYSRGKTTGFFGLMGFVVILVVAFNFEFVWGFFNNIGFIDFLYNIGVFREGDLFYVAAISLALFFIAILLFFVVGCVVFIVLFLLLANSGPIFLVLLYILMILLFPVLIVLFSPVIIYEFVKDTYLRIKNPEEYKERKRQNRRKGTIEWLRFGLDYYAEEKERKKIVKKFGEQAQEAIDIANKHSENDTLISPDKAYNYIKRLPLNGDYQFLVGITYEREFYMLLASPLDVYDLGWTKPGELYCEKLEVATEYSNGSNKWKVNVLVDNPGKYNHLIPKLTLMILNFFLM